MSNLSATTIRRNSQQVALEKTSSSFQVILEEGIATFKIYWDELRPARSKDHTSLQFSFAGPPNPSIDENWTEEDEQWLVAAWDESMTKAAFDTISEENATLQRLWRASCRLMQCSPVAIVSPLHRLVYSESKSTSLWSLEFCEALCKLVTHSAWRGDNLLLTTFIQYAVVCRTGHVGAWRMAMATSSCRGLEAMRAAASCRRSKHIHELCCQFQASELAEGTRLSLDFDLLYHLGSLIEKPPSGPPRSNVMFLVKTADLNVILRALDTFCCNGYPLFTNHTIMTHAAAAPCYQSVFPRGVELRDVHINSFLHECRTAYRTRTIPRDAEIFLSRRPHHRSDRHRHEIKREPQPDIIVLSDDDSSDSQRQHVPGRVRQAAELVRQKQPKTSQSVHKNRRRKKCYARQNAAQSSRSVNNTTSLDGRDWGGDKTRERGHDKWLRSKDAVNAEVRHSQQHAAAKPKDPRWRSRQAQRPRQWPRRDSRSRSSETAPQASPNRLAGREREEDQRQGEETHGHITRWP